MILAHAETHHQIIISADTDFDTLLAASRANTPSVILRRISTPRRPKDLAALHTAQLPALATSLDQGCVAVIEDQRVRIQTLPLIP